MYAHNELAKDFENRTLFLENSESRESLARLIDHTVLKPETTKSKIEDLCSEALKYNFRSVCIPPAWLSVAAAALGSKAGKEIKLCTVIGFPNGNTSTASKVAETKNAVAEGANEIDFVQNVGWVKDENWPALEAEYKAIVTAASGNLVKIILETSLLNEKEIYECALRAALAGVHVIKTSTGFGSRGASVRDIEIISRATMDALAKTGNMFGIKASGGVRSTADAQQMIKAGATRLGTSGGPAIVEGTAHISGY